MVGGLEEAVYVAIILVGPDAEAAQLELDGHVLTALGQIKEMILARLMLPNCRAKKMAMLTTAVNRTGMKIMMKLEKRRRLRSGQSRSCIVLTWFL